MTKLQIEADVDRAEYDVQRKALYRQATDEARKHSDAMLEVMRLKDANKTFAESMEMLDLERRLRADAQANLDIEKKAHEITRGMLAASAQWIAELSGDGRAEAVGADAVPVIPSDT